MKAIRPVVSNSLLGFAVQRTRCTCRATTHAESYPRRSNELSRQQQRRSFVQNPFTSNQTLTATRTLRYPATVIYSIISDVARYSDFVPYCQSSTVTKYSRPAPDGKRYPEEAKLVIGFNDSISEEFTSRVYCVPERVVEAVSGNTAPTVAGEDIAHHGARPPPEQDPSRKDTVMAHLLTRWTLRPHPYKPPTPAAHPDDSHVNLEETSPMPAQERTDVNLAIEFQFTNPLYAALSSAAAPRVAEKMIEAFENRVKAVLDGPANVKARSRMQGVLGNQVKQEEKA